MSSSFQWILKSTLHVKTASKLRTCINHHTLAILCAVLSSYVYHAYRRSSDLQDGQAKLPDLC